MNKWEEPGFYVFHLLLGDAPRQKIGVYNPQNDRELRWVDGYERMWALEERLREARAKERALEKAIQKAAEMQSQERHLHCPSPTRPHMVLERAWDATRSQQAKSKVIMAPHVL